MLLLSTRLMLIASSILVQGYKDKVKITAPYIAEKCNINARALMPALRRLTQVGILRSQTGGKEPGFIFIKNPSEVTLFEIINALEADQQMISCKDLISDVNCQIDNCENCSVYKIINKGVSRMTDDLKKNTLGQHHKEGTEKNKIRKENKENK